MLIDMPTGSGKTYQTLRYIYKNYIEGDREERVIFLTSLKKNLSIEDLTNFIPEDRPDLRDKFEERFIFLDSISDIVLEKLGDDNFVKSIPDKVKALAKYRPLEEMVLYKKTLKSENNLSGLKYVNPMDDFKTKYEPDFREELKNYIFSYFKKEKKQSFTAEEISCILDGDKWRWLRELYPSIETYRKKIIFMSMNKLLVKNPTLLFPGETPLDSELIKGATIFIDEFDATKVTVLKHLIDVGQRNSFNQIELFETIYRALKQHVFPASHLHRVNSALEKLEQVADSVHKEFSLEKSFKADGFHDEVSANFLFRDHKFRLITKEENKKAIAIKYNKDSYKNDIVLAEKVPENKSERITSLLASLRGFISYFIKTVETIANFYQEYREKLKEDTSDSKRVEVVNEMSQEERVMSVLREFGLNGEQRNQLMTMHASIRREETSGASVDFESPFFSERGFEYYSILDNYQHVFRSEIRSFFFRDTPEKILIYLAQKARVIGISATASLPTSLGNYNIDYLKMKLRNSYHEPLSWEKEMIRNDFHNRQKVYDKVSISVMPISVNESVGWSGIFSEKYAEKAAMIVTRAMMQAYVLQRYQRIVSVFKEFVLHEEMKSFLCFLNMHPRDNNEKDADYLSKSILRELFSLVLEENGKVFCEDMVVYLTGKNYDALKKRMQDDLKQGEKRFVISTYQTIGAGQNIHYEIPKNEDIRRNLCFTNKTQGGMKDFDGIYLDKPTNLISRSMLGSDDRDIQTVLRAISEVEYLFEKGQIPKVTLDNFIKNRLRNFIEGACRTKEEALISKTKDVELLMWRTLIQAIGRICRTDVKPKVIRIYFDDNIRTCLHTYDVSKGIYNREFLAFVEKLNAMRVAEIEAEKDMEDWEIIAAHVTDRSKRTIEDELSRGWSNERVAFWKKLRGLVLKHPTLTEEEYKELKDPEEVEIIQKLYLKCSEPVNQVFYSVKKEGEGNRTNYKIHWKKKSGNFVVSGDSARLDEIKKIQLINGSVEDVFMKRGWATSFSPGNFILNPYLFQAIYLGALGEEVGRMILEDAIKITLEDLPVEIYEKFDYRICGTDLYVDFKNWSDTSSGDTFNLNWTMEKSRQCNASHVYIMNLLYVKGSDASGKIQYGDNIIRSVPYLVRDGKRNEIALSELAMDIVREQLR